MKREKVPFDKPTDMTRSRVPAHITETPSSAFGLEVQVQRLPVPKSESLYPSGQEEVEGQRGGKGGSSPIEPGNQRYREVIPPGRIGSQEKYDILLPGPQYVDTVPWNRDEEKDPTMHGAYQVMQVNDRTPVPFQRYQDFQPRTAPIPRALQDEASFGRGTVSGKVFPTSVRLGADSLMTDENSFTALIERDDALRKDLYGNNVAGYMHNEPQGTTGLHQGPQPYQDEQAPPPTTQTPASKAISERAQGPVQTARLPKTVRRPTTSMQGQRNDYVKR